MTKSKSNKRAYLGLLRLINKFWYKDTADFQICMNSNLLLKSWELKKGDAVATLFEQEHKGNGQMVFTS